MFSLPELKIQCMAEVEARYMDMLQSVMINPEKFDIREWVYSRYKILQDTRKKFTIEIRSNMCLKNELHAFSGTY